MSIDINREQLLSLADAAKRLPGRPDVSSLWRWRKRGARGGVKLETIACGERVYTSVEALQRFVAACTTSASSGTTPAPSSRRAAEIDRAEREAAAAGI